MDQYEKGSHLPDINTTKKICEVLGVPVAYLYCEDAELAQLIDKYGKLSGETK